MVTVVPGETLTIDIGEGASTANAAGLSTLVSGSTTGAILTIAGGGAGGNGGGPGGSFSAATCAGGTGFDGGVGGSRSGNGSTHAGGGGGGSATVLAAGGAGGNGVESVSGGTGGTGEGNGGDGGEPSAGGIPTAGQAPGGGGGGQGGGTAGQFGAGANGRVIIEYAVCGNGVVELDEECDDGNTDAGDCCSAACTYEAAASTCGDTGTECTVQDTCDGAGNCVDNGFVTDGTGCGSSTTNACTAADTCDGAGNCQANDSAAGTNCGDAGTECTVQDTCDGSGSCTDNGFETSGTNCGDAADTTCTAPDTCDGAGTCDSNDAAGGTACDDGLYCTDGDACDGSGSCQSGSARDCNDANLCTADSCDEAGQTCVNDGIPVEPASCYASGKGNILFKDKGTPAKNFIKWKWKKGAAVDPTALGSPSTSTEYALCIYDQTGAVATLIGGYNVPISDLWKEKTGQVIYFNKPGAPEGVAQIKGKASTEGKSGMAAKVAGTNMLFPTPYSLEEFVDADPSLIVQMLNSEGACWNSEFNPEQLKVNTPTSVRGVY